MSEYDSNPALSMLPLQGGRAEGDAERQARKERLHSLRQAFLQQVGEIQQRSPERETADFGDLLEQLRHEREQLAELRSHEATEQTALTDHIKELKELKESLLAWRREQDAQGTSDAAKDIAKLQAEKVELQRRLEQAERAANREGDHDSDLQRRFEMAVKDVRDLKQQNQELQRELQRKKQSPSAANTSDSLQGLDWESQKQRMLAELETGEQWNEPDSQDEKLSIEGTIRITDDVVAEKDTLIQDLQQQLESLNNDGAKQSAQQEFLDHDELIAKERERLRELQNEWEAKLRKAEIEISVERAKMARDRRELEEKMSSLQEEMRKETDSAPEESGKGGKSNRRWLARLGLSEQDDSGKE